MTDKAISSVTPATDRGHDDPLTTLQCCSHLSLVVDRQRACSADDRSRAPAHSCGDGDRNSFVASPGPATASSGSRPHLAVTTPTSQPIARRSQIPIAPARRTVVRMPARGFLHRGLSDACPPSAPHCQVTGRRLITLNDSGRSRGLPSKPPESPVSGHSRSIYRPDNNVVGRGIHGMIAIALRGRPKRFASEPDT